jgi:ABC-type multidrug transport system fused ATPase/permease subunit
MKPKINRLTSHVERTESVINHLLRRKRESIQKSLIRPLYQEALKSLFLVIVILVDTLIPLEIFKDLPATINIIFALVILILFLYVEMRIYNQLWGKKGRWSLEKYKINPEKNKEDTN